jgi:REP element-mobilizing transposase RayT
MRNGTRGGLRQRRYLHRLERITVPGAPVFFITVCVHGRERVLAQPSVAAVLIDAWQHAEPAHRWLVGRYVVMPDHVHFFVAPLPDSERDLSGFVGYWKRSTALRIRRSGMPDFRWQRQFFDHLLRSGESYAAKWEYVRANPVRARLVGDASEWPYQGEVFPLEV